MTYNSGTQTMIARTELLVLSQHYLPRYRSSAQCRGQQDCFLCATATKIQDLGVVGVSVDQSDTIHLLRITKTEAHIIQGLQVMGARLIGARLQCQGQESRTLGVLVVGRTVTSSVPIGKYCASIGAKLYDRALRDHLKEMNTSTAEEVLG